MYAFITIETVTIHIEAFITIETGTIQMEAFITAERSNNREWLQQVTQRAKTAAALSKDSSTC
jgi:hypothetical protein